MTCVCESFGPMEHLSLWKRRATPIITRLIFHGHGVNSVNMQKVVEAIINRNFDLPRTHSHHLPWCGESIRNNGKFDELEHKNGVRYLRLFPVNK